MRSYSKARISGLAATEHDQNRTLPDLPFPWPWEIWVRDYTFSSVILRPCVLVRPGLHPRPPAQQTCAYPFNGIKALVIVCRGTKCLDCNAAIKVSQKMI